MTGWPMRIDRRLAALLLAVLAAGLPGAARADRLVSNSQLLSRAVRGALDSLLASVPAPNLESVVILPAAGQKPEWALENEIAGLLQKRAKRLTFHGPLTDTTGAETASDTGKAEGDSAAAPPPRRSAADRRPLDPTANQLEYRVAALEVTYPDVHRTSLLGAGEVDRVANVSVGLRLLSPDGRLLWSRHARGQAEDRVPEGRLHEVEDRLYMVPVPTLPDRSLMRYVEPAIVVGLVTGLVYLFYTNRN